MRLSKPLPMWSYVSLFVVSVTVTPLVCRLLRRPDIPPRTLMELTQRLSQTAPELYVIPQLNSPEGGVWVSQRPQTLEQLGWNPRVVQFANRWQGVVHCTKATALGGEAAECEETQLQTWGEYGMRIGPLLFFGDPALLQRIRRIITTSAAEARRIDKSEPRP